jgi:glycosyltransferase involved in cell wall biosynthesis
LELVREGVRFLCECDPLVHFAAVRTDIGVATTAETRRRMLKLGVPRVHVCTQTALTESEFSALDAGNPRPSSSGTIRFVSMGRFIAWKGFHLGLKAFARMRHTSAEYWIVGSGPEEQSLRRLARSLGVDDRVCFLGAMARADAFRTLLQCDVLVHPSLHDSCPWVCAEAMAASMPVICLDIGGPGMQVTDATGFKIAAHRPAQAIQDMAAAMDALTESATLRIAMGTAARVRAREHFNAGVMREEFRRCYEDVAGMTARKRPEATAVAIDSSAQRSTAGVRRAVPVVSAIMATYNKGPWVAQAIDSLLAQTFTDWELILVNDASTDETAEVLARYSDPRIRIHELKENVGRARARNVALGLAQGRYIAVCDSDDISMPTRFDEHVTFLDTHPEIDIVSAHMRLLSANNVARRFLFPIDHESIARRFARGKMGVAHGASMIRAECFQHTGGYCPDLRVAEDFELFRRFSTRYRFETIPKELLLYRSDLGAWPFPMWIDASRWHRYALYRSNCDRRSLRPLSFDEFVRSWRTNVLIYSVDSLRFAHFNLRAHVFSSHVLR